MERSIHVSPSVLAADLGAMEEALRAGEKAGADSFHFDIMDGEFAPNIALGPGQLAAARRVTSIPLNVHLMVASPYRLIGAFCDAGADGLAIHVELPSAAEMLGIIRAAGREAGLAINPTTPAEQLATYDGALDYVIVMSVDPGFAGQSFIPWATRKVAAVREAVGADVRIYVDGGVGTANVHDLVDAGATHFIVGSYFFSGESYRDRVIALREAAA